MTRFLSQLRVGFGSWLVLWASVATSAEVPYTTETLENGMQLIAIENHKVPLVTVVLTVKAGAFTETPDIDGLTHLWEHMFFKGNARLANQEVFNQRIRELGLSYNGDTSAEMVRYYFTLPSAFLDEGLQFMSDAIATPKLEQSELKKERRVVMDEYDRSASQPGFELYRLRRKVIYGDLAHLRDPLGQRHIIEKATREQLLRIKEEVFVPSNSALLVAGDFDPQQLIQLTKKHFKNWHNPKDWKPLTPPKFQKFPASQRIVMTHDQARNVNLMVTFDGPRVREDPKASFAADVLINLLGARTGKFYKRFIDSGIALDAGLSYPTQAQTGEIILYAVAKPENAKKVESMLLAEPAEWLKKEYFNKTQLESVHRNLLIDYKRAANKPSEYVKSLAFWWAVTGLDYYNSYLDNLRATGLDEIRAFVNKFLIGKPAITTILTSKDEAEKAGFKDNSAEFLKKHNLAAGGK